MVVESNSNSNNNTTQTFTTEAARDTLSPKWNRHFDLQLGRTDLVHISLWNQKKVMHSKKEGAGFLGCVKLVPHLVTSLKDTGCEYSLLC